MSSSWGDVADAEVQKLRTEIARDRLHTRTTGSLPLDLEQARFELTQEQRARRSSRPTGRRWKGLAKIDDRIDELGLRLEAARQERQRAEGLVQSAPADDARTLAAWMTEGERGKRPDAILSERVRERDAAGLTLAAIQQRLDEALEERLRHVEKHRASMLKDAQTDVAAARKRIVDHVRGLSALREELIEARETLVWAATYPEQAQMFGFVAALALGLREPVERFLETKARVDFSRVLAVLEADADALASRHDPSVLEALGTAPPRTPLREAMWSGDPEYQKWQREELERAQRLGEYGDAIALASEVRE